MYVEYYNTENTVFHWKKCQGNSDTTYLRNCYGKYISVTECNTINVNGYGSKTIYSQWICQYQDNNNKCRLKNLVTGLYLRIYNNIYYPYHVADVGGTGGAWTVFRIHKMDPSNDNIISLESCKCPSNYIAINRHDCSVYSQCVEPNAKTPNTFKQFIPKTVTIQHETNKYIAIKKRNQKNVCSNYSAIDIYSEWKMTTLPDSKVKFRNGYCNGYLRIIRQRTVNAQGSGGKFTVFKYNAKNKTLESNHFPGFYLATSKNDNSLHSITKDEYRAPSFNMKFDFKECKQEMPKEVVLIRNVESMQYIGCNKDNILHVRVSETVKNKFFEWSVERYDNKIKLKNVETNRYLRIHRGGANRYKKRLYVDIGGGGGEWTLFKYDLKAKTLESNAISGYYVSLKTYEDSWYAVTSVQQSDIDNNARFELIKI